MVHGPCRQWKPDASCIKDGICCKGFPKPFQAETVITRNGTLYSMLGRTTVVRMTFVASSRTIGGSSHTSHTSYLDLIIFSRRRRPFRYDAHINIECVMSLAAVKYITKYTHKVLDRETAVTSPFRSILASFRNTYSPSRTCRNGPTNSPA
ncbi:hypothetical protein BGY98DRAFT_1115207 [Russula aff. rugulosa BPL654]|nr:hypothetical protein BGY98DRAFT_1115207 [Russula aff. rugulosa BPL654]